MNIEAVMAKQLMIMSQQLEVLGAEPAEEGVLIEGDNAKEVITNSLMKLRSVSDETETGSRKAKPDLKEREFIETRNGPDDVVPIKKHGKAGSKRDNKRFKKGDKVMYYPKTHYGNDRWKVSDD